MQEQLLICVDVAIGAEVEAGHGVSDAGAGSDPARKRAHGGRGGGNPLADHRRGDLLLPDWLAHPLTARPQA